MSSRRTTIRPLRGTLRLAAAIATCFALGPAKAEAAGCGRHVAPTSGSVALVDGLLGAPASPPGLRTTAPQKPPCSGPQCSEGRRGESPSPSTIAPTVLHEWASLTTPLVPSPPTVSAVPTTGPAFRPLDPSSRPERPPRPFA